MPSAPHLPFVRKRPRVIAALSIPIVMSLVLAGCGGDDNDEGGSDEPTSGTDTAGQVTLNGEWPLTGEKLEGDLPEHPVYVVKIDNTSNAAPQIGLSDADLVVEELVEGGSTRLAAFYHSAVPKVVGPVRSMRATDIGIVLPSKGVLVASGGAHPTKRRVAAKNITALFEGATGFYRDESRSAPYNLFMHLTELAEKPGKKWDAPTQTYLPFGSEDDFSGEKPVKQIDAVFSSGETTTWKYTDKGWVRPGSYATQGDDFTPDNILLLKAKVGDAGYLDPAGNPVPETKFYGKGKGVLVHDDEAVMVRWSKDKEGAMVSLTTKKGDEVTVPAGKTFIELLPNDGGDIQLSKK